VESFEDARITDEAREPSLMGRQQMNNRLISGKL
jgi:hypothetical protein